MRLAFFLLLLGNLAFYVWSAGYLGPVESGREPERLTQQIAPEKIRIVRDVRPTAPVQAKDCRLVNGLSSTAAASLRSALEGKEGVGVSNATGESVAYWVIIPNMASQVAAEAKLGEVQRRGVSDGSVVADPDSGPFAVSLGVFASDKAAQEHLAELRGRGVRSAVVEARAKSQAGSALEVRGPSAMIQSLADFLPVEAGATLTDCPTSN